MQGNAREHDDRLVQAPPPQPAPDGDTAPFWNALAAGQLTMCRCGACRVWQQPPLERCRKCARGDRIRTTQRPGNDLHVHLIVQRQPAVVGFFDQVPYAVAIVELDEQHDLRLPGRVVGIDVDDVAIGMRVRARIDDLPGGEHRIAVWIPEEEENG